VTFGTEFDDEAAIARSYLALEPGKRIFLMGLGMQEDRKVAADLAVVHSQQIFPCASDYDPVAFLHRKPEQGVSNRSTDQIHLHA